MQSNNAHVQSKGNKAFIYGVVLIAAVVAVYANSFSAPFLFDDEQNILENTSIRSITPLWQTFSAPEEGGLGGRPLINFSLALNYALSGYDVWSYHLFNILLHITAALLLFAIVLRTLQSFNPQGETPRNASEVAFLGSLIWAVHPVTTQAVTYIIQRCESLAAVFIAATLLLAVLGFSAGTQQKKRMCHLGAVFTCLLGVGAKETIVAAPFLVLLYDLSFVNKSIRSAVADSKLLYGGLLLCLVVLAEVVMHFGMSAGHRADLTFGPLSYAKTQAGVVLHYIGLVLWPKGLCLDYGWAEPGLVEAFPQIVAITAVIVAAVFVWVRNRRAGFAALCFLVLLTPSSSFFPIQDAAFDHRMYLPSAALCVLGVTGGAAILRKVFPAGQKWAFAAGVLIALAAMTLTIDRNMDFQSEYSIWADTVEKRPNNVRANSNLGVYALEQGRLDHARAYLSKAVQLDPTHEEALNNLGTVFRMSGNPQKALEFIQKSLALAPDYKEARINLGSTLLELGNVPAAEGVFAEALERFPESAESANGLAAAYLHSGRTEKAEPLLNRALKNRPEYPEALTNLGTVMLLQGKLRKAESLYKKALSINPDYAPARKNLEYIKNSRE